MGDVEDAAGAGDVGDGREKSGTWLSKLGIRRKPDGKKPGATGTGLPPLAATTSVSTLTKKPLGPTTSGGGSSAGSVKLQIGAPSNFTHVKCTTQPILRLGVWEGMCLNV
jgi:hypothetical protein